MANRNHFLECFLTPVELLSLSDYERYLYYKCLEIERFQQQADINKDLQNKKMEMEKSFPNSSWGLFVFKPPRASQFLRIELQEKFFELLNHRNLSCLGLYEVELLSERHINAMYPGDTVMPYWSDLKKKLLNLPAIYFLVSSRDQKDIHSDIEEVKGWYRVDKARGRLTSSVGLRAIFRQIVESYEGYFQEMTVESDKYEDSGIHAPCSTTSRFLQLIGFMAVDSFGARWVRTCLPWLL